MLPKLKVVNLFGGPGSGKSRTRAGLFSKMKFAGFRVEEATEYAKDLTYDGSSTILADQLLVTATQNYKLSRLTGKADWMVSDSPLLLGLNYAPVDYLPKTLNPLIWELWNSYENYNFFMLRTPEYSTLGRPQTFTEAILLDEAIRSTLVEKSIPFTEIYNSEKAPEIIFSYLFPN